jgi:hypothetical protein
MNEKIEFWDCSDQTEILMWDNLNEAVEMHLDDRPRDEWPEMLTVYGYAREIPEWSRWPARVLERLLESLDDDYGNPEDATAETDGMKLAAEEFIRKVAAEYQVWSCKRVATEEINVMDWVKEHAPHWLEQPA